MATDLSLLVDGQRFLGWTSASISASLDSIAPTFDLTYADRWFYGGAPVRLSPGQACDLMLGNELILRGFVDEASVSESAGEVSLSVAGRSRTGDLVDCSAVHAGEFENQTPSQIAAALCAPYGISVTSLVEVDPLPFFAIEPGESVFEAIARATRLRGLYVQSTPEGDLRLHRSASMGRSGPLRRGQNILSVSRVISHAERYASIRVVAQESGLGEDAALGAQVGATVTDPGIRRHRPLLLVADTVEDSIEARAHWERNVRVGRGSRVSVTVQGWTSGGKLWRPGQRVLVDCDSIDVTADLVISGVQLSLSRSGTTAQLELADPAALELEPISEEAIHA